jgi:hypothetical protein
VLRLTRLWIVSLVALSLLPIGWLVACPFCSAVTMTLSEEIKQADAAVIARLVKAPKPLSTDISEGQVPSVEGKADFEIVEVLKGPPSIKPKTIATVLYFGQEPVGTEFLMIGTDPKDLAWGTPTALSKSAREYVAKLTKLPETGPERLLFFQQYFENPDSLLASDSYDEFAKTPYAEVQQIGDKMQHDKLVGWIKNPETSTSHRRLYLTMLGVCGTKADVPVMEEMVRNEDRQVRAALDALIACYLNLTHGEGMPLVEDLFLKNTKAEYTDTYAAIMALRFHGQETNVVPKARLTQAMRYMLDRPQLADLVIPDLARWQDWSVMDRLVKLFKDADDDSIWVRVPVVNYLRACPLPEAKKHIEELAKIDPEAVKRASQFFPIGAATPPAGAQRPKDDADDKPAEKSKDEPAAETPAEPKATQKSEAPIKAPVETAFAATKDVPAAAPVAIEPPTKEAAKEPSQEKEVVAAAEAKPIEPPILAPAPIIDVNNLVKMNKPERTSPLEADAKPIKHNAAVPPVAVVTEGGNRRAVLGWAAAAGVVIFFTLLAIMRGNRKRAALVMKAQR